jgi:hypothetical protein
VPTAPSRNLAQQVRQHQCCDNAALAVRGHHHEVVAAQVVGRQRAKVRRQPHVDGAQRGQRPLRDLQRGRLAHARSRSARAVLVA